MKTFRITIILTILYLPVHRVSLSSNGTFNFFFYQCFQNIGRSQFFCYIFDFCHQISCWIRSLNANWKLCSPHDSFTTLSARLSRWKTPVQLLLIIPYRSLLRSLQKAICFQEPLFRLQPVHRVICLVPPTPFHGYIAIFNMRISPEWG